MTIHIQDLTFKCIIGILDFERQTKQKVAINLSFEYKYTKNYFIDYSKVAKLIKKRFKEKKYLLLEDSLEDIQNLLYKKYDISNLRLKISKPDILKDCVVSLSN